MDAYRISGRFDMTPCLGDISGNEEVEKESRLYFFKNSQFLPLLSYNVVNKLHNRLIVHLHLGLKTHC